MALEKIITEDKISVVGEYSILQVRTKTAIVEDGVEISSTYHRHTVTPTISADDLALESAKVRAIAAAVHTDEVKAAYSGISNAAP